MILLVGIDDTDVLDSKGTNQLAKAIVQTLADRYACVRIVRHQLLVDPRVPYTSQNGSASIALQPRGGVDLPELIETCRQVMREWFVAGSDPGLCGADNVTANRVAEFGRRCQQEVVAQHDARNLAAILGIHLEGLGGTEGGVIGALAAIGLAATRNDGRIVQLGEWPDDLAGPQPLAMLRERDILVRRLNDGARVEDGVVEVGKRLRPNVRGGRNVLFVEPNDGADSAAPWRAVRVP